MKKTEKILTIISFLIKSKKQKFYELSKNQILINTNINKRSLNRYLREIEKFDLIELKQVFKKNEFKVLIKF